MRINQMVAAGIIATLMAMGVGCENQQQPGGTARNGQQGQPNQTYGTNVPGQENQPGQENAQPGEQPGQQPGEQPGAMGTPGAPGTPGAQQPGEQNAQPGMQPGEQNAQPGEQNQPGQQPGEQPGEQAQPGEQNAQPGQQQPSAMQPGSSDQQLQEQIRQAVSNERGIQTNADSWQAQVNNGKVTLTGTVASQDDHQKILAAARRIAGNENVTDQLQVAAPTQQKPTQVNPSQQAAPGGRPGSQ